MIQPRHETVLFRIPLEIMSCQLNNFLWSGHVVVGFPHCQASNVHMSLRRNAYSAPRFLSATGSLSALLMMVELGGGEV